MTSVLLGVYVGFVAFLGAAIGSFLNVVIWRVPEGTSLISPPSHCPKCGARIRWFDNVPVFGWLLLGGKCRDCRAPISSRYPTVEFLCGSISALFAAAIFFGGWTGLNSQTLYWEDLTNWLNVWNAATAPGVSPDAAAKSALFSTEFSTDALLRLANSGATLAFVWAFAAFAALVLGFVEWDRGRSPSSLVWSAAAIPFLGLLVVAALESGKFGALGFPKEGATLVRTEVFAASVLLGAAGALAFWRAIPKGERLESAVLGALWGFAAGWIAALPGALALAGAALFVRRRTKRATFGLLVFGAIYLFAIGAALYFATRCRDCV